MRRKFLSLALALGLVTSLFAGALSPASGQEAITDPLDISDPLNSLDLGINTELTEIDLADLQPGSLFFPWVSNGEMIGGMGPWQSEVSIQNIEDQPVTVDLETAGGELVQSFILEPGAKKTLSAGDLGLPAGSGGGLVAKGSWQDLSLVECLQYPVEEFTGTGGESLDITSILGDSTEVLGVADLTTFNGEEPTLYTPEFDYVVDEESGAIQFINRAPDPGEPVQVVFDTVSCLAPSLAGATRSTVGGEMVSAVDGYTALTAMDLVLAGLGTQWAQPIFQTNNEWDTVLHVTNVSDLPVTVAGVYLEGTQTTQGDAGLLEELRLFTDLVLQPGETKTVQASDHLEPGHVGSVRVVSTGPVVTNVNRIKAPTSMGITNNGQSALGGVTQYAPLAFHDFNDWNTGINIANLFPLPNEVIVNWYDYEGNLVGTDTTTVPLLGMKYIYLCADKSDPGCGAGSGQVTSVQVISALPISFALDEVKYIEGTGHLHAMSYDPITLTEGLVPGGKATIPLVTRGQDDGMDATSGINLSNAGLPTVASVTFLDEAGQPVAQPAEVELGQNQGVTVYTLDVMESGFTGYSGTALIQNLGPGYLTQMSNNVDYAVEGDGSAVFTSTAFKPGEATIDLILDNTLPELDTDGLLDVGNVTDDVTNTDDAVDTGDVTNTDGVTDGVGLP